MKKQTTLFGGCIACMCLLQLYSCVKPPPGFDPFDNLNGSFIGSYYGGTVDITYECK